MSVSVTLEDRFFWIFLDFFYTMQTYFAFLLKLSYQNDDYWSKSMVSGNLVYTVTKYVGNYCHKSSVDLDLMKVVKSGSSLAMFRNGFLSAYINYIAISVD